MNVIVTVVSGISDTSAYTTKCFRYLWKDLLSLPCIKTDKSDLWHMRPDFSVPCDVGYAGYYGNYICIFAYLVNPGVAPTPHALARFKLFMTLLFPTFGNPAKRTSHFRLKNTLLLKSKFN